jgi:hypothetical protein
MGSVPLTEYEYVNAPEKNLRNRPEIAVDRLPGGSCRPELVVIPLLPMEQFV